MSALLVYVDILVRGVGLIAASASIGGVAFVVLILRAPLARANPGPEVARSLSLIAVSSLVVSAMQLGSLLAALAEPDSMPVAAFVDTPLRGRAPFAWCSRARSLPSPGHSIPTYAAHRRPVTHGSAQWDAATERRRTHRWAA
jgi:hypothetical protein